tara:strand:+ start:2337 stop:2609 length:273 start_codon:yes stop_codon:yes gene_type:complete
MFHLKAFFNQNKFLPTHLLVIVAFSLIYMMMAPSHGTDEDKENYSNFADTLYYTTITHFTIGFGDVTPKSKLLRALTMLQVVLAFSLMNL